MHSVPSELRSSLAWIVALAALAAPPAAPVAAAAAGGIAALAASTPTRTAIAVAPASAPTAPAAGCATGGGVIVDQCFENVQERFLNVGSFFDIPDLQRPTGQDVMIKFSVPDPAGRYHLDGI